jgi:predicted nucleotidyltransferase
MRYVSTRRRRLAPIFCSDTQLQILGATYLEPERRFTIPELVARSSRPQPTVAREVERITEAGLLESELRSGRRTVWAAATSPIFNELQSLLIKTVGPRAVLEDRFRGVRGVERAFIYGSWASRYHGEPGPQPQDIDLLVIGSANVADIRSEADIATRTLGRDVNVTVVTPAEWDRAANGSSSTSKTARSSNWICGNDASEPGRGPGHRTAAAGSPS